MTRIFWATQKIEFIEPWDGIPRYSICSSGDWTFGQGQKYDLEDFDIEIYEND